ncbi:MAG TPA: AmmeMemoRadiSam system protein B [Vicinamibacteria bacterium]|nr:AmmeMemoRadiSam system protein B [Vicinamibacteria bacterium]
MTSPLPALRRTLEMMPSPVPESPGLLVRDPFRYAESVLILPPPLAPCLLLFDGRHDESDLREVLVRLTGTVEVGAVIEHLLDTLSLGGFLENDVFEQIRAQRHRSFAEETSRAPQHAGAAYPSDAGDLRALLARYLAEAPKVARAAGELVAIAAPHVSPEGGWRSYGAAYGALGPDQRDKTFVILGTSHYGQPERFGLTHKPFRTPLGDTTIDRALVSRVAEAAGAECLEDYCHSVEHSIEFQVLFLQHLYGPAVRVVPILCGPFARATQVGGRPEDDEGVRRVLDALGGIAASEAGRLVWIAGVDMAHVGRRYGDRFAARAEDGLLLDVAARDRERCRLLTAADHGGFWSMLQQDGDPLRWCGASPLYALVAAVRPSQGTLLHYEQWNIDPQSVVSCAALAFIR